MISLVVQFICVPCTWVSWVGEAGYYSKRVPLSGIRMLGRASVGWWCWGGISDVEPDHRRWMRARGWFHSTGGGERQPIHRARQLEVGQLPSPAQISQYLQWQNSSTPRHSLEKGHRARTHEKSLNSALNVRIKTAEEISRYQRRDGQANRCTLLKWGISPLEKSHVWGAGRGLVTSLGLLFMGFLLIFDDHPTQNTLTMYVHTVPLPTEVPNN